MRGLQENIDITMTIPTAHQHYGDPEKWATCQWFDHDLVEWSYQQVSGAPTPHNMDYTPTRWP